MRRLTPATVLACIALFAALAGTATAGAVALITGAQIKNGTIGLVDLSGSAKRALKGKTGPRGSVGPPGATGAPGPAGITTLTEVVAVKNLPPGAIDFVTVACPAGQNPVSGGATFTGAGAIFIDRRSGSGWAAGGDNFFGVLTAELRAYAYCSPGITLGVAGGLVKLETLVHAQRAADAASAKAAGG